MRKTTGTKRKRQEETVEKPKRRPAPGKTIEAMENHLIKLAYDLVERRLRLGTATSQEVTELLRRGSSRAELERAKLENENKLLMAKADALSSQKNIEDLYSQAIKSMGVYQGRDDDED